ncbi:MAG: hypothetical protein JXB32_17350 [Deltaproteobacteria bacterium]|nr:hypothetical protein [Deltaproteobacteria bacterium]
MLERFTPLLVLSVFLPGCAPEGTGDAEVQWAVGLTGSCAQAGLDYVTARLETRDGTLLARQDAPCDAHVVRFRDLPVGSYRVRLSGFDEQDVEAYEATISDLTVQEGLEPVSYLARLAPRPGSIDLAWFFQGGRLCSAYGVEQVLVSLYTSDLEIATAAFRCDRGLAILDDLLPGSYEVRVDAIDTRGVPSHSFVATGLKLRPGHRLLLDAELVACQGDSL